MGTPPAALPALQVLRDLARVVAVVTRPDRPRGRSGKLQPTEVRIAAEEYGLPVLQPDTPGALIEELAALGRIDVGVVVAFGMLLPAAALTVPRRGFLNIHFSLLPRWRGAAPVARALLAGDRVTGVSLMQIDEGLDTGPLVATGRVDIDPEETAGELTLRLAHAGAALLSEHLEAFVDGRVSPVPQPAEGATYAPRLTAEETRLSAEAPASRLLAAIRAYAPQPGARFMWEGIPVKVLRATRSAHRGLAPGKLELIEGHLLMGTRDRTIELLEVQTAGRRRMSGAEWARGRQGSPGRFA